MPSVCLRCFDLVLLFRLLFRDMLVWDTWVVVMVVFVFVFTAFLARFVALDVISLLVSLSLLQFSFSIPGQH